MIPNLYSVHMDPEVWPEPTVFRPERFIDDSGCIVHKERVIPFSIGELLVYVQHSECEIALLLRTNYSQLR